MVVWTFLWISILFYHLHIFLWQYHAVFTAMAVVLLWNQVWWSFPQNCFCLGLPWASYISSGSTWISAFFSHYLWRMASWLRLNWSCSLLLVGWLFSQYWLFQNNEYRGSISFHLVRPSPISSFYIHLKVFLIECFHFHGYLSVLKVCVFSYLFVGYCNLSIFSSWHGQEKNK